MADPKEPKKQLDVTAHEEQDEEEHHAPKEPASVRFQNMLTELIYDVMMGAKLNYAKQKLHSFCESLTDAEKDELASKITAITTRHRDIATALTTEAPSLLAKLQQKENS